MEYAFEDHPTSPWTGHARIWRGIELAIRARALDGWRLVQVVNPTFSRWGRSYHLIFERPR